MQHCKAGMSGVINQNFDSDKTLTAYKAKAALTDMPGNPADFLTAVGGSIVPNKVSYLNSASFMAAARPRPPSRRRDSTVTVPNNM